MERYLVDRFDGGIVDGYQSIQQGANGRGYASQLHNFWLDENGKPFTRWGIDAHDVRISAAIGFQRISGIYIGPTPFNDGIYFQSDSALQKTSGGSFTEIEGPEGNVAIPGKTNDALESFVAWQKQIIYASGPSTVLPHRIYAPTSAPTFLALTLGLPALESDPTLASAGGTGSDYIYAFHRYFEFTDYDGTVYAESGPVTAVSIEDVGAPNANNITIDDIPTLANTVATNYDVSTSSKVKVFRTVANGTALFLLTTLDNGDADYVDATSDATLQERESIYTSGSVLDYNPPPVGSRYVTQVNGFFWYATDRLVTHSVQDAPGACPDEYYEYPDQQIRGLSSTLSYPILFCDSSVYRIDGNFDELGDGGYDFREISSNAGCVSHKSIVRIPGGLVWAGNGGFYFTDGDQVKKISLNLEARYKVFRNESISGTFDSVSNTVTWAVSSRGDAEAAPNDIFLTLFLNFGITPYSVFTTWGSADNIFPTAIAFSQSFDISSEFRSKLLIGENRGYLLYTNENAFTDAHVDLAAEPSEFKRKAVIYRYESLGMDLGADATRKYCTELTGELWTETDTSAQFLTRRDDGGPWQSFSEMRTDEVITWGISEYDWDGVEDPVWDAAAITEGKRMFPSGTLRSTRRQIGLTNALTYISKSDTLGTATVDASLKTVTLDDATFSWPDDCEVYELAFDTDTYGGYYIIEERVSDTVVKVFDPLAELTSGAALQWLMRGYRKNERIKLLSYAVYFDQDGETQAPSRGYSGFLNA